MNEHETAGVIAFGPPNIQSPTSKAPLDYEPWEQARSRNSNQSLAHVEDWGDWPFGAFNHVLK
jgi:hypothetical protein